MSGVVHRRTAATKQVALFSVTRTVRLYRNPPISLDVNFPPRDSKVGAVKPYSYLLPEFTRVGAMGPEKQAKKDQKLGTGGYIMTPVVRMWW